VCTLSAERKNNDDGETTILAEDIESKQIDDSFVAKYDGKIGKKRSNTLPAQNANRFTLRRLSLRKQRAI